MTESEIPASAAACVEAYLGETAVDGATEYVAAVWVTPQTAPMIERAVEEAGYVALTKVRDRFRSELLPDDEQRRFDAGAETGAVHAVLYPPDGKLRLWSARPPP